MTQGPDHVRRRAPRRCGDDLRKAVAARALYARYVGYVGFGNLGDEALYLTFRDKLLPSALVAPERGPSLLKGVAAVRYARHRDRAVVVLGGGTLINTNSYLLPLERARRDGQPIVVFGTGVADLDYWRLHPEGRYRGREARWVGVLHAARYVGVRGPRSLQWMRQHGLHRAELLGDIALSWVDGEPLPRGAAAGAVIGINLGSHDPVSGGQQRAFEATRAVARELSRRGHTLRVLSLHPIDHDLGARFARGLGAPCELVPYRTDVAAFCRDLIGCDVVIGQRLHATVLAAAHGIPNLSLAYQPKCYDFLEAIHAADLAIDTLTVDATSLQQRVDWLLANAASVSDRLLNECGQLRALQRARAAELVAGSGPFGPR